MKTQSQDNELRKFFWEIAQSMSVSKKLGCSPKLSNLPIDHCVTRISELAPQRLFWKRYMAAKSMFNGQRRKGVLDKVSEIDLSQEKNRINKVLTKERKFVFTDMYFLTLLNLLLILIMCDYSRH